MDKSQLYKVPLKYGVAGGIIAFVLFLTLYYTDGDPVSSNYIIDGVLMFLFVFFSLKELRDYKYGGKMLYWQGMTGGFVCYALIALISALTTWVYLGAVDPDLYAQKKQEKITILTQDPEKWVEQLGQEDYEEAVENVKAITPFSLAADDFVKKLLIGFFLTTIIALFYKRK